MSRTAPNKVKQGEDGVSQPDGHRSIASSSKTEDHRSPLESPEESEHTTAATSISHVPQTRSLGPDGSSSRSEQEESRSINIMRSGTIPYRDRRRFGSPRLERDFRRAGDRERTDATTSTEEESSSDSDAWERRREQVTEEMALRRVQDQYYQQEWQPRGEVEEGRFGNKGTQRLFTGSKVVREYFGRSGSRTPTVISERRPSPVRLSSSKDQAKYLERSNPLGVRRRGPGRARTSLAFEEPGIVGASTSVQGLRPREVRPPALNQSRSSPRSTHGNVDSRVPPGPPRLLRSETMPYPRPSVSREVRPRHLSPASSEESRSPTPARVAEEHQPPVHQQTNHPADKSSIERTKAAEWVAVMPFKSNTISQNGTLGDEAQRRELLKRVL